MLQKNKSWDIYTSAYNGETGIVPYKDGQRLYITKDTTINEVEWQKVSSRSIMEKDFDLPYVGPFTLSEEYQTSWYLRENIEERKVYGLYFHDGAEEYTEVLLYDFTVGLGDIVPLSRIDSGSNNTFELNTYNHECVAIETITLDNGEEVKSFEYQSIDEPDITEWFGSIIVIEGLGSKTLFNPASAGFDLLGCVEENGIPIWGATNSYGCNSITTSIPDFLPEQHIISPNPSNGIVEFPVSINFDELKIYNSVGQIVKNYETYKTANKQVIEFEEYLEGLYFVVLYRDGAIHTEKLILK
ncbi:MAG: T9SS type A sorting domain-containing protein [Chitinophagales bacterium]